MANDGLAIEVAPGWWDTTKAAVQSSNTVGAALSSEVLWESLIPTDKTPVGDEDIDTAIKDRRLEQYVDRFTTVQTRGQLDAKLNQITREAANQEILNQSGWQGFLASVAAGTLDLPSLIGGGGVGLAAARSGFGPVKAGLMAGASSGAVQAVASEAALHAVNELETLGTSGVTIAASTVLGGLLGAGVARYIGPRATEKLGAGLRDDVGRMASGEAASVSEAAFDSAARDAARFSGFDPATIEHGPAGRTRNFSYPDEVGERLMDAVGRDLSPSELAMAKSLGVTPAVKGVMKVLGGNVVLDLATSRLPSIREAVFNFANVRSMIDGTEASPSQVMNIAARLYGEQGIAKRDFIEGWRRWSRDVAEYSDPVLGRLQRTEYGARAIGGERTAQDEFSRLVVGALALGKETHPDPAMAAKIAHPEVQKAAKAYRTYDKFLSSEAVRSGLLREGHVIEDHLRHVYHVDTIGFEKENFQFIEAGHAYNVEYGKQELAARTTHAERVAELKELSETRLADAAAEISEKIAKDTTEGLDQIIQDRVTSIMASKRNIHASLRLGLSYTRELSTIEDRVARELRAARNKLNKRSRERGLDIVEKERLENEMLGLDAKYGTILDGKLEAATREHEARWQAAVERIEASADKRVEKEMAYLTKTLAKSEKKLSDKAVKEIEKQYRREMSRAMATLDKEVGDEAQARLKTWASNHAEGVYDAIVYNEAGGSHGKLTGGNIRGGNKARNVYTPTRELYLNNWIEQDLLKIMERQSRQDGIDAVIARKFRRNRSTEEDRLHHRNHPDAYWRDGTDQTTVPDLELRSVLDRARAETDERIANIKQTIPDEAKARKAVNKEIRHYRDMRIALEDMVNTVRATEQRSVGDSAWGPVTTAAKALQFSIYMGKNAVTNLGDLGKLPMVHGVKDVVSYLGMRGKEKLQSAFDDGTLWRDHGKQELREVAAAANVGLERYNMNRLLGQTDVTDPFASAIKDHPADRFASFLTQLGSKAFLIGAVNDFTKTLAFGVAQHKLAKFALEGADVKSMKLADQNWLRYIGVDNALLKDLRAGLHDVGVTQIKGEPLRFDPRLFHPDLQDRIIAALHKDSTSTVVTPDRLSKPRFYSNPVVSLATQFSSFVLESGMSTTSMLGQRVRTGEVAAPLAGIAVMVGLAWITQYLSILAGRDENQMQRFWDAHDRNPGFVAYNLIDRSGLLGPFTYLSNYTDDIFGVGIQGAMRVAAGDNLKDKYPYSRKRFNQNNGDAWKTLGGPAARTIKDVAGIAGDVFGSLSGSKHGYVPLFDNSGRVTQGTIKKIADYTPIANAFYLRGMTQDWLVKPFSEGFPKHR